MARYIIEVAYWQGGKPSLIYEYTGTEKGAKRFARNILIKKGKKKWVADIYKKSVFDSLIEGPQQIGRVYYEYGEWEMD